MIMRLVFKQGHTVDVPVTRVVTKRNRFDGALTGVEWTEEPDSGVSVEYLNIGELAAVLTFQEAPETSLRATESAEQPSGGKTDADRPEGTPGGAEAVLAVVEAARKWRDNLACDVRGGPGVADSAADLIEAVDALEAGAPTDGGIIAEAKVRRNAAYRIRAELVCCDVYGRLASLRARVDTACDDWLERQAELDRAVGAHALCYWGEAAARLAEGRPDDDEGDEPATWAHDPHCNTTHIPRPEPCPPAREQP